MAKEKETSGPLQEAPPAQTARPAAPGGVAPIIGPDDQAKARFKIATPHRGFRGERAGVNFNDGVGYTDDPVRAKACQELGYATYDHKTKEAWWPGKE